MTLRKVLFEFPIGAGFVVQGGRIYTPPEKVVHVPPGHDLVSEIDTTNMTVRVVLVEKSGEPGGSYAALLVGNEKFIAAGLGRKA